MKMKFLKRPLGLKSYLYLIIKYSDNFLVEDYYFCNKLPYTDFVNFLFLLC